MEVPVAASLQAAMEGPVTASLGAMSPLLRKLHSLMASEHSRPKDAAIKVEIQFLKEDLEELCMSLKDLSEAEETSFTAKWWMKEVRELCYDTEDYFDESMHSGAGAGAGVRTSAFRIAKDGGCRLRKISRFSFPKRKKLKRRPQISNNFSELMARVEVASESSKLFQLAPKTIKPDFGQASVSRLPSLQLPVSAAPIPVHVDTGGRSIVGVEEPFTKLVNLLAFDDDNQKQLKVVPIFGFAGVGKTTLARALYDTYGEKFQCRAFLRVSRNPDMMRLLTSMLSQIKAPRGDGFSDVEDLIDNIIKHLQGKRFVIIIDDLWSTSVWDVISRAFPNGDFCSTIITTTQIEAVALACCDYQSENIFKMRPLNDGQSRKLFFSITFGSELVCPPDLKEVSYGIIKKCGGLPLATVNIASLLASQLNLEQWKHIRDSLPSTLRTNPTSQEMKEVLNLIYNNLSPHLKTCLLYLIMYPEGYTIRKNELVKQWVVEGFIGEGQDTEEIAGGYFDELVSRGMIQPVDTNSNDEVLSCTVHHMVLDLIRYKSIEENFIIVVNYFQTTRGVPDKVRRMSIQFGDAKGAKIPDSIRMSQVRSLIFMGFFNSVPSIVDYRLLRVLILHVWADRDKIFDLTRIRELFRLRYLKIECNITVHLPDEIRGLHYLETLEVHARVAAIPSDIGHLEKLLHLGLPSEANLPVDIGGMTSLRTLGYFDLGSNSEDNVKDLGKLTNLQNLHLTCCTGPSERLVGNMKHLGSILGKFNNLKCLTLDGGSASSMSISCDGLSSVSPALARLQRLELLPRVCIFPSIPEWFQELGKLSILKIAVRGLSTKDIVILQGLPALTALSLYVWTAPEGWIVFDNKGFPLLKYFKFMCTAPYLSFMEGAMPNVRKLKLGFNANRMKRHRPVTFGFRHLTGLREISVKFGGTGADESDKMTEYLSDMAAAVKHPVNVKFVDRTFFGEEDKSSVTKEREHEIQEHKKSKTEHSDEDVDKQVDGGISTKSESSSHLQNPEHKTVAIAMEDAIVSASTGAMNSVLRKLVTLMGEEYANLRGTLEKVRILKDELCAMNALLEKLTDMSELNMQMRDLRNQMRELTYDIENCIDGLMLQLDKDIHQATTGYRAEKWDVLQQFIDQIRNLTAQVGRADLPSMLHSTGMRTLGSGYMVTEYDKVIGLVGIDGPRHELVRRMMGGEQQLQVACILGSDGLGKTTLATEVYNQIKGQFDYRVFITVKDDIKMHLRRHRLLQKRRGPQ